ncbi:MAG TPA: hypothetical protein VMH86_17665 [Rhizomicrobium sp.]|nr:hypothetical protein [Rhizomicrobium sp.]
MRDIANSTLWLTYRLGQVVHSEAFQSHVGALGRAAYLSQRGGARDLCLLDSDGCEVLDEGALAIICRDLGRQSVH